MSSEQSARAKDPFPYLQETTGMSALIRNYDWSQSSLGSPDQWPEQLHASISIALNSGFPTAIYWGPDFTLIYNDAWSPFPGNRHPWALGKPGKEVWPDIWGDVEHQFRNAMERGEMSRTPDTLLLMTRFGYIEETYFDYNLSPIRDSNGTIGGVFNIGIDTTYRVLMERRNNVLNRLARIVTVPRSRKESFSLINEVIDSAVEDIPFCCIYTLQEDKLVLQMATGMDERLGRTIPWPFDQLKKAGHSVVIGDLKKLMLDEIINCWPEPCVEAMLVPLKSSYGGLAGMMAMGISARKRIDKDYKHFLELAAGYMSTSISNGGIFEDEVAIKKQLVQREESLRRKIEDQLKLVTLVNNSVELMSILELDGKNSYINPAGMRMLGFETFEQVLTTPISHLHEPADIEFVRANVLPAVMNEGKWSGQMNVRHLQTGEVFPVYNNAIRIDDPETKNTIAIGAVMRDLRPEIAAQKALVESERNLRRLILHAPVAMCMLKGPDFVVDIANELVIELWGKNAEDMMNKPVFQGLPEAREQGLEDLLINVYKTGVTFVANERPVQLIRRGIPETLYLNFVYEPYKDPEGSVIGILAVAIDVTHQVKARREIEEVVKQRTRELEEANTNLIRTNSELTRSNINLGEFAYAASHDLKEPARKIHVFADRLNSMLSDRMTSEEKHFFTRMQVAASRMTTLINDLLTYSEVNQDAGRRELVNLNDVVKQVLGDLDLEIEQKNAQITVNNLPDIRGNSRQLQQAFHNLISNALKYSKAAQAPVIDISSQILRGEHLPVPVSTDDRSTEFLLICVKDEGVGFDPQDAERIFNVFTRLHITDHKGTGVGLSIVRKVVQNHGGYVWAESQPGVGSWFWMALRKWWKAEG